MAIEDYNAMQEVKFRKAVDNFEPGKGGFPFYPMYFFYDENNQEKRTTGFVAISDDGRGYYYGETERKAVDRFKRGEK